MAEKNKFKKGSIVKITSSGKLYPTYKFMATELEAANWITGRDLPADYKKKYYKVVAFQKHETFENIVYLIEDIVATHQFLISEDGLILGSKYDIGDKVTIRSWTDMKEEFGLSYGDINMPNLFFVKEMKKYCGKTYKITKVNVSSGSFEYKLNIKNDTFTFTEEMFEKEKEVENIYYIKVTDKTEAKAILGMAFGLGWKIGNALEASNMSITNYIEFNIKERKVLTYVDLYPKGKRILAFQNAVTFLFDHAEVKKELHKKEFIKALRKVAKTYVDGTHEYNVAKCDLCKTLAKIKGISTSNIHRTVSCCDICPWVVMTGKVCYNVLEKQSERVVEIMDWIKRYEKMED